LFLVGLFDKLKDYFPVN